MLTVGLSLLAALTYGSADFCGGLASRRMPAAVVVVLSQVAGLGLLAVVYPFVPGHFSAADLAWGAAAGVFGAVGIAALYAALSIGRMGIVSPVTAVIGASVPVLWGLCTGERPAPPELAGIALAFVAVAFVSADAKTMRISLREPGLLLAIASGSAIGVLYVLLAQAAPRSGLAVVGAARLVSIPLLLLYSVMRRESLRPPRSVWKLLVLAGGLDMAANILYVLAARAGLVAVAAVLTSLYPAATVFLARLVLGERLNRLQWAGVACAAAGILLIAS